MKLIFFGLLISIWFSVEASSVYAGDGSITDCQLRRDFSSPSCSNAGFTVNPMGGGGSKQFIFNAPSGSSGTCQVQCGGNGKITSGSGSPTGSVNAGGTWTYNFSTGSDGGNNTNFEITATIEIIPSPPSPSPMPSAIIPKPSVTPLVSPTVNPTSNPSINPSTVPISPSPSGTQLSSFGQNLPLPGCASGRPYVSLSWEASQGADYYFVYFYNQDTNQISSAINVGGKTFFEINESHGLIPNNRFAFLIRAVNNQGQFIDSDNSTWSHYKFGILTLFEDNCEAPQSFSLNNPVFSCISIFNPAMDLSWSQAKNAVSYAVYYGRNVDQTGSQAFPWIYEPRRNYHFAASNPYLLPGERYGFLIAAGNDYGYAFSDNGTWSHIKYGYSLFPKCEPPIISLWLNNNPYDAFPLKITPEQPVEIKWQVLNAESCSASSTPHINSWSQTKNPVQGSQKLSSLNTGKYIFTLTCTNEYNMISSNSITLLVENPEPYLQTTGGDVHSNNEISVPR